MKAILIFSSTFDGVPSSTTHEISAATRDDIEYLIQYARANEPPGWTVEVVRLYP